MREKYRTLVHHLKSRLQLFSSKLFIRIYLFILVLLVIPLSLLMVLNFQQSSEFSKEQRDELYLESLRRVSQISDNFFEVGARTVRELSETSQVIRLQRPNNFILLRSLEQIQTMLEGYNNRYSELYNLQIYYNTNDYLVLYNSSQQLTQQFLIQRYQKYFEQEGTALPNGAYRMGLENYSFIYHFYQQVGVVKTTYDFSKLQRQLGLQSSQPQQFYFIMEDSSILLSGQNSPHNEPLHKAFLQPDCNRILLKENLPYVLLRHSSTNGLTYCLALPELPSGLSQTSVWGSIFLVVLLSLFAAFVLSWLISYMIYQPIDLAVKVLQETSFDHTNLEVSGFRLFDEVSYIQEVIQNSQLNNKLLEKELEVRQYNLQKAQSIALQYQINPHFMYNTLEVINWKAMALTDGKNEVSQMLVLLSKFMRSSLDNASFSTTVAQEVEHAKQYFEVQRVIFKDTIQVEWEIEPDVEQCEVIRLTLQPLLENSIIQGLHPSTKADKHMKVAAFSKEDLLYLVVYDNGIGISPEDQEIIQEKLDSNHFYQSQHVGLSNINQRIKLFFGKEYGLVLQSEEGVGTVIMMKLPKRPYQATEEEF